MDQPKDGDGHNIFEGGFLGLDNISVFDRSQPLPPGFSLKQADATGWMAMFTLNMTVMALELATEDSDYESIGTQTFTPFLAIANAISGHVDGGISLWDPSAGFFKDLIDPDGKPHRIDVYSPRRTDPAIRDRGDRRPSDRLRTAVSRCAACHRGGTLQGGHVCTYPDWENKRGEHLLAVVDHTMLRRILERLLSEREFLSPYGVRSVSRIHAENRDQGVLPGIGRALNMWRANQPPTCLAGTPTGVAASGGRSTIRPCKQSKNSTASLGVQGCDRLFGR